MNFARNTNVLQKNEFNAGGNVHVPPTDCPRPARASANSPAHVERTGRPVTQKMDDMRTVRPVPANGLILSSELTA